MDIRNVCLDSPCCDTCYEEKVEGWTSLEAVCRYMQENGYVDDGAA